LLNWNFFPNFHNMRAVVLVLTCLACTGYARRVQANLEKQAEVVAEELKSLMANPEIQEQAKLVTEQMKSMMSDPRVQEQAKLLAAEIEALRSSLAGALKTMMLAHNPSVALRHSGRASRASPASVLSQRMRHGEVNMADDEPSDKAVTIGAAALAGTLGVYFTGELSTAVIFAALGAYASTLANGLGDATKTAGAFTVKAYDKTVQLNEEYEILGKAKGATDTVVTAVDNLNKNYGITDGIDEKLALTAKINSVTDKIEEVTSSVTSKVDDLKSKAKES